MMAYEEYDQEKGYHHTVLYHLQTRPLPVSFHRISEHEIIFPTEEAIHKSFAIGRCDETLDVLPNNDFNADKK